MAGTNLAVNDDNQLILAGRIDAFQHELQNRIRSLNDVVDRIQAGWKGAASQEYDSVQRGVNENLKRILVRLVQLEEAMRLGVKGFTADEQERVQQLRQMGETGAGQSKILDMI
ncbi:WXG100 family type VII secretion target [Streptomyces albus]|uniref:WXG100 family type VII secretion target n=1 Tax=Streptomyces albus TaxID=1888 RepID=UPI0004CBD545|nr:WXG100 family type VII secretion target [Streptomyces albus]